MPKAGELVQLVNPKGKRYMVRVGEKDAMHTHDGYITMDDIIAADYGATVNTHMGRPYRLHKPTLYDLVKGVKRQTQIIYPKDIGYICMKLGIGPGRSVIEAGSGSGSLTIALSWFSGPTGKVYTYERRPEFLQLCKRNLEWAGVGENVEQINHDIDEGFLHTNADALFLDVRTPWEYLDQAAAAVSSGSALGFLLPTTNQVSMLVEGLEKGPFSGIEIVEILIRRWKGNAERLRPDDRMVAHTGFLIFARKEEKPAPRVAPAPAQEAEPEAVAENESQAKDAPESTDPAETTE